MLHPVHHHYLLAHQDLVNDAAVAASCRPEAGQFADERFACPPGVVGDGLEDGLQGCLIGGTDPRGLHEGHHSRYHDIMPKQTTVRLPDELADEAEAVARVRGISVNQLIIDSLAAQIELVRRDEDFTARARRLLERDRELLDRLGR